MAGKVKLPEQTLTVLGEDLVFLDGPTPPDFQSKNIVPSKFSPKEQKLIGQLVKGFGEVCDQYVEEGPEQSACWQGVLLGHHQPMTTLDADSCEEYRIPSLDAEARKIGELQELACKVGKKGKLHPIVQVIRYKEKKTALAADKPDAKKVKKEKEIKKPAEEKKKKEVSVDPQATQAKDKKEEKNPRKTTPHSNITSAYFGLGYSGWSNRLRLDANPKQILDNANSLPDYPFPNGFSFHGGLRVEPNPYFRLNIDGGLGHNRLATSDKLEPARNTYLSETYISAGLEPSLGIPLSKKTGIHLGGELRGNLSRLESQTLDHHSQCVRYDLNGLCLEKEYSEQGGLPIDEENFAYLPLTLGFGASVLGHVSFQAGPVEIGAKGGPRWLFFPSSQDENAHQLRYDGALIEGYVRVYTK